jgi:hypothetical protein
MQILIGADPEVFVTSGGALVSGYNLIPGTKQEPHPVNKGAVQVDGMALEFNINPAKTRNEFIFNINTVIEEMKKMIPNHDLLIEAAVEFPEEIMNVQPREATMLGCDSDFNAYTISYNPPPCGDTPLRTAAGHVHVGWTNNADVRDEDHLIECAFLARQMDVFLGVPSLLFDDCDKRRELYGKAGAFRPKPYGMEYRVLSNKWLQSEGLMKFVYDYAVKSAKNLFSGRLVSRDFPDVEDVINSSNRERAKEIVDILGINMVGAH